jgi:hypothetical protein
VSKVEALLNSDREMMMEFSRLCVSRLNSYLPLRLFLSLFQHFLDANVLKEISKDRLIISDAASGFEAGKERSEVDANALFEMTKEVDAEFLRKLSTPFFSIEVRYDDFEEIRKKRIVSLVSMVFELMSNWQDTLSFSEVVKKTFEEDSYRKLLIEVLHLYNIETKMLSNSITFHGRAVNMKDLFAEKLFRAMEQAAGDISDVYTGKIYRDKSRSSAPRRN